MLDKGLKDELINLGKELFKLLPKVIILAVLIAYIWYEIKGFMF